MSHVEESLKALLTKGGDFSMMFTGSPVQNVPMDSKKQLDGSLNLNTSADSSEDNLKDIQNSMKILNIINNDIIEPNMRLNQKQLNYRLSSTNSLSSNEGRPNTSIAVISMKNLLDDVTSTNCVDSSDGGDLNCSKAPVIREERVKLLHDLLEFYMSDRHLMKDLFLLKKFKELKGWISIKFLMSYKRIRRTAKDIDELKEAIKMCPLLEMNEEETRVQHLSILPNCIREYIPSKIAIIGGLPEQFKNINEASRLMCLYGDVVSLQLIRPGGVLPEVLQTVQNIPEMRTQWCIVVEYEEMHSAGKLVNDINKGTDPNLPTWAVELVISWKEGSSKISGHNGPRAGRPSLTSMTSSGIATPQCSSTHLITAYSSFVKNEIKTHGLENKESLVTPINSTEDQTIGQRQKQQNQLQRQQNQRQQQNQLQQPQNQRQHLQTRKIQNLKSNARYYCEPSSTDDNWRSNQMPNLKSSNRHQSKPSSKDDNWRRFPMNAVI